jgi:protease IV
MKTFFTSLLGSVVGVFISLLVIFLLVIWIVSAIASSSNEVVTVRANTVLQMDLNQDISDRGSNNPLLSYGFSSISLTRNLGLDDILRNIRKAGSDENIRGIYLDLSSIHTGIATIEEIRNALLEFKNTGKFIFSYSDSYTQGSYYLATVSDSIFMNPAGLISFVGLRAEVMFFKGAFEKLGLEPEVIRHGKFKSAVEPFISDRMSPENKEQVMTYIGSIWNHILDGISQEREIPVAELNRIADEMVTRTSLDVLNCSMVDGLTYKDEMLDLLKTRSGLKSKDKLRMVSMVKYDRVVDKKKEKGLEKDKIAVIYAMGDIIMGEGKEGNIGSDRISRIIRVAREDTTVKAIVLSVNSGGGSALASEIIWREVKLASDRKPVVASLGDVAASGGYYIVCAADTIVASPNTITGSIGVFGLLLNAQKFMNNKLGITTDVVKTNAHSDLGSVFRPLTDEEIETITAGIESIYGTFLTRVSEGRGISKNGVDSIAQGRVWSAIDGKRIGLVDVYGGLEDAVKLAAAMAKIEKYRTVSLPRLPDPIEQLLQDITGEVRATMIPAAFRDQAAILNDLNYYMTFQGIQARMPASVRLY